MELLIIITCLLVLLPLITLLVNWTLLMKPTNSTESFAISVLIPARNEAANIGQLLDSILVNQQVDLEVIVLDDNSSDATAAIVQNYADKDSRVSLQSAPPLPAGCNGKQHACAVLAEFATKPYWVFIDADVILAPNALNALAHYLTTKRYKMISGIPRQITATLPEQLFIPLIHSLLLGYLPFIGMKLTTKPGFGAACGQLIAVEAAAYRETGGHQAIIQDIHDGLALPRLFRKHGYYTDWIDITALATCRMYHNWSEVWSGFSKNATAGMAKPVALPIWTILLFGGHVLPFILLLFRSSLTPQLASLVALACILVWLQKALLAWRFKLAWQSVLLHPIAMLLMLVLQWQALLNAWRGRQVSWKGRDYSA